MCLINLTADLSSSHVKFKLCFFFVENLRWILHAETFPVQGLACIFIWCEEPSLRASRASSQSNAIAARLSTWAGQWVWLVIKELLVWPGSRSTNDVLKERCRVWAWPRWEYWKTLNICNDVVTEFFFFSVSPCRRLWRRRISKNKVQTGEQEGIYVWTASECAIQWQFNVCDLELWIFFHSLSVSNTHQVRDARKVDNFFDSSQSICCFYFNYLKNLSQLFESWCRQLDIKSESGFEYKK